MVKQQNPAHKTHGQTPKARPSAKSHKTNGTPHPVDVHVGSRVRLRRTLVGLSQEKLGEAVGLTFQQIQKYERGSNRIGASRLKEFSDILDVPVSFFFDGTDDGNPSKARGQQRQSQAGNQGTANDPLHKRETLELVRAYYQIHDPNVRKRIFEMVKALAKSEPSAG